MSEKASFYLRMLAINPGAAREQYQVEFGRAFDDPAIDDEYELILSETIEDEAETIEVPENILLALLLRDRKRPPNRPAKTAHEIDAEAQVVEYAERLWRKKQRGRLRSASQTTKQEAAKEAFAEYSHVFDDYVTVYNRMVFKEKTEST